MPDLKDYLGGLQQVMQTAEYANADFRTQQNIYNRFIAAATVNASEMEGFAPQSRQRYYDQMTESFTPSFLDPQIGEQVTGLMQQADSGDETAINQIDAALAQETQRRRSLIVNLAERTIKLFDPEFNALGQDLPEYLNTPQPTPDQQKALDYLRYQRMIDPEWQRMERREQALGTGLEFAEILGTIGMGAGFSWNKPRALGQLATSLTRGAAERSIARAGARFGNLIYGGIQSTSHAVATATVGTAREFALDAMNDEFPKYPNYRSAVEGGLKTFGTYLAFDIAANFVFDTVMPILGAQAKMFMKWPKTGRPPREVIAEMAFGDTLSREAIQVLDEGTREQVLAVRRATRTLSNVDQAPREELLNVAATARGGRLVRIADPDRFQVSYKSGQGAGKWQSEVFNTLDEAEEFMNSTVFRPAVPTRRAAEAAATRGGRVRIHEALQVDLPNVDPSDADVLANVIAPRGGRFTAGQVEDFTKQALRASNATDEVVQGVSVQRFGNTLQVRIPETSRNNRYIRIPQTVKGSEIPHIKKLVDAVQEVTSGRPARRGGVLFSEGTYRTVLEKQNIFTPEWGLLRAKQLGYAVSEHADGLRILTPQGESLNFTSARELNEFLITREMTPEWVEGYLRETNNLNLRQTEDGKYFVRRGKRVVTSEYENVQDLARNNPQLFDKLPETLAPQYVIVDGGVQTRIAPAVFAGDYDSATKFLNNFKNIKSSRNAIQDLHGNKIIINREALGSQRFTVEFEDLGYTSPNLRLQDAKKMLTGAYEDFDVVRNISLDKGYRMEFHGGRYIMYDGEGHRFVAKTLEDARKVMADEMTPIPSYAPELLMSPDAIAKDIEQIPEHLLKPFNYLDHSAMDHEGIISGALKKLKSKTIDPIEYAVGPYVRPPQGLIESFTKKGADPYFGRYLNGLDKTTNAMVASETKMHQALLDIVGPFRGKRQAARRQSAWYDYLTRSDKDAVIKEYADAGNPLTRDELDRLEQIRDWLGRNPESGLFQYFGVDPEKFLTDYLPRIREAVINNPGLKELPEGEIETFWKTVFADAAPPKELDEFFKHSRSVHNIQSTLLERDPLVLLNKYNMTGHRGKFLGPLWEEFDQTVKGMPKTAENEILNLRLTRYRADMMGIMTGPMAHSVEDAFIKMWAEKGLTRTEARRLMRGMMSMPYMATMGLRVWLPVRNSFQSFITLAPRYGNRAVVNGYKKVLADKSGDIVRYLRENGVIDRRLPVGTGYDLADHKALDVVLGMYKNSDELNRAITFTVATDAYDSALKRLQNGDITWDDFLNRDSGFNQLYRNQQEQVLDLLNKGHYDAARLSIGDSIVKQTQFNYRSGNTGMGSTTLMGKLAGQFGTYSFGYAENLIHGFKSMKGFGTKAAFAGTFLANTAALYTVFTEGLGVNANNFLPHTPLIFTGGPNYELMNTLWSSLGVLSGDTYTGRQAAAEAWGLKKNSSGKWTWQPWTSDLARLMVPGSYMYQSVTKAVEAANDGDYYRMIMNLGSFPLEKDYFARPQGNRMFKESPF